MASDAAVSPNVLLVQALSDQTGLGIEQFRGVILTYETTDDRVGCVSYTCCPEHTVKLLGLSVAVVVDDPATPFGQPCPG